MTTNMKIIIGFVIMILLLGGMAALGYMGIQKSSTDFISYRHQARANVAASDILWNMALAVSSTYDFVSTRDEKLIEKALLYIDTYEKIAQDAQKDTTIHYRKEGFISLAKQTVPLKNAISLVKDSRIDMQKVFEEVVKPNYANMATALRIMADSADRIENHRALYALSTIWDDFALCVASLGYFYESAKIEDGAQVRQLLPPIDAHLKILERQILSPDHKKLYESLSLTHQNLGKAVDSMILIASNLRNAIDTLHNIEKRIISQTDAFNKRIDGEMRDFGVKLLQDNEQTQNSMLLISIVGIVLGIIIATVTIIGLGQVLRDLSEFARSIAEGDFTYTVRTREKGDINVMMAAMHHIPNTLKQIIDRATALARDIRVGKLRERLDTSLFPGSFADLAVAVNAVSDAYTVIIDAVPTPIMACDKNFSVMFYNKAGQYMVGGNLENTPCKNNLGAPECGTDNCFGKQCMESRSAVIKETAVEKDGKRNDISVTAVHLTDMDGNVAGLLEIFNDISEIRSQQRTMMAVASRASQISNRVAAASEELSAQVEQVSRGAEMQRSRIASTASAMLQMNATVLEVAKNASQASEQSELTRSKANDGAGLVNKVVQSINMVNAVATNLQDNMEGLGAQAKSIGGVMNVISDIADQTNLLALNAAIEAARAGEAGRGFAVVADEVRKLAEKTMSATHEVGTNISAIQASARRNIDEVDNAVKSINEATVLANSSGQALAEIVELASANSSVVTSIATAAEEQSATSEEISRAIEEINQVVGDTTEGMIQSSASVQEMSLMAQELRRVMEGLR